MKYLYYALFTCTGVLFGVLAIGQIFSIQSTIFEYVLEDGHMFLKFNLYNYLSNFTGSFSKFNELVSSLGDSHYNFSGVVETLKSLCNIMISLLNTTLLPFSFIGSLLNVFLCLFGLPLNSTNPIYLVFNGIAGLQIPYIPV